MNNIIITKIEDISVVNSKKGDIFKMDNRQWYGLSFCKSGQITYEQNGIRTVSDKYHAVILPKGACYTLYRDKTGEFPLINFSCTGFERDRIYAISISDPQAYITQFSELYKRYLSGNKLTAMALLYTLLADIEREEHIKSNPLYSLTKYIKNNISSVTLSNTELAEVYGVSEVYLRQLFKTYLSTTPKQYILEIRIIKAKELLLSTSDSISNIALTCGFVSIQHFCRAFKSITGYTPTDYRKSKRRIII